jgi:hypothetical protein
MRHAIIGFICWLSTSLLHAGTPTGDASVVEKMPSLVAFWTFGEEAQQAVE